MDIRKDETGRYYDTQTGRYIKKWLAEEILAKKDEVAELEDAAQKLIDNESEPPEWLKDVVVKLAYAFGVTPQEFASRIEVVHPTPKDPVILVDGKPVISWV